MDAAPEFCIDSFLFRFRITSCEPESWAVYCDLPNPRAVKLLSLLLLFTLPIAAQALDFTYTTSNGTITITGYTGPGGAVTIPTTINGLPVTSIGDYAFANCYQPDQRHDPRQRHQHRDSWRSMDCTSLTSVTIGNSVTSIGESSVLWMHQPDQRRDPDSVTSIGAMRSLPAPA